MKRLGIALAAMGLMGTLFCGCQTPLWNRGYRIVVVNNTDGPISRVVVGFDTGAAMMDIIPSKGQAGGASWYITRLPDDFVIQWKSGESSHKQTITLADHLKNPRPGKVFVTIDSSGQAELSQAP